MQLLILGGTRFLGRHLVIAARSRGHEVTLFNRGITNPTLFPEVEKLRGDRAGNLSALTHRQWDAVIDTCGYVPTKVDAVARLLSPSVGHYTFISSISVYRDFSPEDVDETAPVATLPAGVAEDEQDEETYGARKALCETAAEARLPGRVLSVRAGLIVGPYAESDRYPYWVRRVARGGEVLAPGDPEARVQLIDVRDLAEWIIRMIEARQTGVYNATGPAEPLTFEQMLAACREATRGDARFTWVDGGFLIDNGIKPFTELPFWLPGREYAGFMRINCRRALATGLTFRSPVEMAHEIWNWDGSRDTPSEAVGQQSAISTGRIGLTPQHEAELLSGWKRWKITK